MVNTPLQLPPPPSSPGASSQRYSHQQFGPDNGQFMTIPQDGSTSTGEVDDWAGFNPLAWFDKQVTYINEVRYFNTFRAERVPSRDRVTKTPRRTGIFEDRRDGNMCWREEKVITDVKFEAAYMEVQRYELWRINLTQENYYEFVTGLGGVTVDAAIDLPAAAAGVAAERAATAAAAEGVALGAGATRLAIASRALGAVGVTYLMFQVFTGAWVAYSGGSRNAAGDMLSEGWEFIRHFYADPVDDEPEESWEVVVAPHPCSEAEKEASRTLIGSAQEWIGTQLDTARGKLVAAGTAAVIVIGGILGFGGGDEAETAETTATAAASVAAATAAAEGTPIDFGTPPPTPTPFVEGTPVSWPAEAGAGQVLVFLLDGIYFLTDPLVVMDPHPGACEYEHVHGGEIRSLRPERGSEFVTRTEHLGDCGYGPPNFFLIDDPR